MPKNDTIPSFLTAAQAFYGPAFDQRSKAGLARSMEEWGEMDEDEQSFAVAHLSYLNLRAQAGTQRLLTQIRDVLEDLAEDLSAAVEAAMVEEEDDLDDDVEPLSEEWADEPVVEDDDELPPEIDDVLDPTSAPDGQADDDTEGTEPDVQQSEPTDGDDADGTDVEQGAA